MKTAFKLIPREVGRNGKEECYPGQWILMVEVCSRHDSDLESSPLESPQALIFIDAFSEEVRKELYKGKAIVVELKIISREEAQ